MIRNVRHILRALAAMLLLCGPAAAQPPLLSGPRSGCPMCADLPDLSEFLNAEHNGPLFAARIRKYETDFQSAEAAGDYSRALQCCDSLLCLIERHRSADTRHVVYYADRGRMLRALGRGPEACTAYFRAVKVQDSLAHLEQVETVNDVQIAYELDRLALDRATLSARHHKAALISVALMLLAILSFIGYFIHDMRRSKRLQLKLLRNMRKARVSEEKKTAFINSMCHEVRTPLNCIAGFSELLGGEEVTPEMREQFCEIIQENRRQLRYMFDDMVEVAYLEGLDTALPKRYIDLCALCRTQLRSMKVKHPKPGVDYIADIPGGDINVYTNDKYLTLLLTALLDNARKFTEQGSVRLHCERLAGDQVLISVSDTGCGISEESREQVFERFTKLDTFSCGNGLGLYLCRLIVRHLHGSIRIDPAYTPGTRILVTLPSR